MGYTRKWQYAEIFAGHNVSVLGTRHLVEGTLDPIVGIFHVSVVMPFGFNIVILIKSYVQSTPLKTAPICPDDGIGIYRSLLPWFA